MRLDRLAEHFIDKLIEELFVLDALLGGHSTHPKIINPIIGPTTIFPIKRERSIAFQKLTNVNSMGVISAPRGCGGIV